MKNVFSGCMPALMTPCNNDFSPNFELLLIKAKELIDTGMSAVIYCGSMGGLAASFRRAKARGCLQIS